MKPVRVEVWEDPHGWGTVIGIKINDKLKGAYHLSRVINDKKEIEKRYTRTRKYLSYLRAYISNHPEELI